MLQYTAPITGIGNLSVLAPAEAAPIDARLEVWNSVPNLSTGVASSAGDHLEIAVSAEMYQPGGSVWFRALVDGKVAQPSDVLFKTGSVNFDGVRTFTFVQPDVSAGQHLVEIQWRSGSVAKVRDRVLTVHSGHPSAGRNRLAVVAAPSGPLLVKSTSNYEDIPGLALSITTEEQNTLAVVFSGEAMVDSGRLMVRALVDGAQIGECIFREGGDPQRGGARSFTFARSLLSAGNHEITLQWRAVGGVCRLGDRTMAVSAAHFSSQRAMAHQPQSALAVQPGDWIDLPVITSLNALDAVSTVAITFSAEVLSNQGRLFVRALVDGEPASPGDVTLIQGGRTWRAASYTFVIKNLSVGRHRVTIQGKVDPRTKAQIRRCSLRVLWKRRSGSDFVQPFLGMEPLVRTYQLLVIGFDPLRPNHERPAFALIKATFEGDPGPVIGTSAARVPPSIFDEGPNLRDWLAENSGGVATIGQVRYVGCADDHWHTAPPERQGNWYWDHTAWDQMWKDALAAADPEVDFHSFDTDHNNRINTDDLLVAIVRPQADPYGTLRGTSAVLDGDPTPLVVPVLDLYLSSNPDRLRWGVGVCAHELAHLVFGAMELYNGCSAINSGYYSIMDQHFQATHLDAFEKMKNGMVQPLAIELTKQSTATLTLPSVERHHQILLLHDVAHVAKEYFLIENRFPGKTNFPNYDGPLGAGAIVVWQIFEDLELVHTPAVCPGDPRFIRRRAVLKNPGQSFDLEWADGSPAGSRVTAITPNSEQAEFLLERL
jgi:M6 family metalloprotease-like protein